MKILPRLRGLRFGYFGISLGRNVQITKSSCLEFLGFASFGDNSFITSRGGEIVFGKNFSGNQDVIYNSDFGGKLQFGNDCLIGPRCIFRTSNHNFESHEKPIRMQGHISKDISIGNDVWLGANVIVLPGVSIGSHAVVGAGSVVTKDIPEFGVAVGNPARTIKLRN
jgi:acetyltransferase-like isoleucine patch superfamily enzyme